METKQKYLIIGIGIFLMILFATITGGSLSWTVSPFYIIGIFLIILGWASTFVIGDWRGKTSQVISNRGHMSIRTRDIITIPWQEPSPEDNEKKITLGSMTIMLTGGFDVGLPWGITWPGPIEAPVYIFPSNYHEKEQHDYHIKANMTFYKIRDLPSYLRDEIHAINQLPDSKNRVHPTKTPIWYGTTSHMDGSATPENLMIERERKHENRELTEAEERLERQYKENRKQKAAIEKQYFVGKPLKPIDEE